MKEYMKKMIENIFPPKVGDKVRVISRKDAHGYEMESTLLQIFGKFPYEGIIVSITGQNYFPVKKYSPFYQIEGKTMAGKPLILSYYRHEFEVIV